MLTRGLDGDILIPAAISMRGKLTERGVEAYRALCHQYEDLTQIQRLELAMRCAAFQEDPVDVHASFGSDRARRGRLAAVRSQLKEQGSALSPEQVARIEEILSEPPKHA